MTKDELRDHLLSGGSLNDAFDVVWGQDAYIVKAEEFSTDDEIIYIPDMQLNDLPYTASADPDDIDRIIGQCYTGEDFVELCEGDTKKAEELFRYCDWQHPESAIEEGVFEED